MAVLISGYNVEGPGLDGVTFTAVITPAGADTGSNFNVTPSDNATGVFSPTFVTLSTASPSATFTYLPPASSAVGYAYLTYTNSATYRNPNSSFLVFITPTSANQTILDVRAIPGIPGAFSNDYLTQLDSGYSIFNGPDGKVWLPIVSDNYFNVQGFLRTADGINYDYLPYAGFSGSYVGTAPQYDITNFGFGLGRYTILGGDGNIWGVSGNSYNGFVKISPQGIPLALYEMTGRALPPGGQATLTNQANPYYLNLGADGNIYFIEYNGSPSKDSYLGKITPSGVITFAFIAVELQSSGVNICPPNGDGYVYVLTGPRTGGGFFYKFNASDLSLVFKTPLDTGLYVDFYGDLIHGSDGRVWGDIGKVTAQGVTMTAFNTSTGASTDYFYPLVSNGQVGGFQDDGKGSGITLGPDGNIWQAVVENSSTLQFPSSAIGINKYYESFYSYYISMSPTGVFQKHGFSTSLIPWGGIVYHPNSNAFYTSAYIFPGGQNSFFASYKLTQTTQTLTYAVSTSSQVVDNLVAFFNTAPPCLLGIQGFILPDTNIPYESVITVIENPTIAEGFKQTLRNKP